MERILRQVYMDNELIDTTQEVVDNVVTTVFANSLETWAIAALIALGAMLILLIARRYVLERLAGLIFGRRQNIKAATKKLVQQTKFTFILVISIYAGSKVLSMPEGTSTFVALVAGIAFIIQIGIWAHTLVEALITARREESLPEDPGSITTLNAISLITKGVIWTIVLLLVLDNIPGIQVTTLIASLGIGGIAIGLAVQNILGDLFASLSIALDKPFVIGDFIVVGEYRGNVEHVGLKSTRVRSISGEQLIFGNADLLGSRIQNFKRMTRRRAIFNIGVTYQTPADALEAIPTMLKEIVERQENATIDRAHFQTFGDFALIFEVVYYVEAPDYPMFMDIQQAINLQIFRAFEEAGIEFAYPTQTLFVQGQSAA
jgi:small-conductance mechanosensitive channel